jgi:hypothetical protein
VLEHEANIPDVKSIKSSGQVLTLVFLSLLVCTCI